MRGVREYGCGFEAQLESVYRFLNQPDPYQSITRDPSNFRSPAVLTGIGVLIVGIATFLFDVVLGRTESLAVGVPMLVLLLLLLLALPEGMLRRHTD